MKNLIQKISFLFVCLFTLSFGSSAHADATAYIVIDDTVTLGGTSENIGEIRAVQKAVLSKGSQSTGMLFGGRNVEVFFVSKGRVLKTDTRRFRREGEQTLAYLGKTNQCSGGLVRTVNEIIDEMKRKPRKDMEDSEIYIMSSLIVTEPYDCSTELTLPQEAPDLSSWRTLAEMGVNMNFFYVQQEQVKKWADAMRQVGLKKITIKNAPETLSYLRVPLGG